MAHISGASKVKETSATTGTGDITVTGAVSGFRTLAAVMPSNGDTMDCMIQHSTIATEWEFTRLTRVSSTVFSRATPFASSNSGAAVTFSAGGLLIFATRGEREIALDNEGVIDLPAVAAIPAAPPTDFLALYGRKRAGRMFLDAMGPSGRDYPIMPHVGYNGIAQWLPASGTTITINGMPITSVGTVSTPSPASTNLFTSIRRWRLTSAATANSVAENRAALAANWRGNAAGLGGFTFVARLGLSTLSTNCRGIFGLTNSTGAISTTQIPGALQQMVGFTWNATETTFRFQHAAAATPTRIDLGANFPTNSTTAFFTFTIHCNPNASDIFYRAVREDTGSIVEGNVSTNIPSSTTFLAPHLYMANGGDASAVAFDCARLTIEADY